MCLIYIIDVILMIACFPVGFVALILTLILNNNVNNNSNNKR